MVATSDIVVAAVGVTAAGVYIFRDQIFGAGKPKAAAIASTSTASSADSRDFVAKLKAANKRLIIFYGSQTGTAEEYAIRFAKEAKAKFGLSSLVCDPEEFDFENLDTIPEDCAAVFFMASYGEGEPTDNAVQLMQNMGDDSFAFSNGEHKLEGLRYIVFGLGNKTYEHFNLVARNIDKNLSDAGATRIGERGEGDDDRSMEEDYMEWKDSIWEHLAAALNVEEGAGGDSTDFEVKEVADIASEKVYLGELSARALTKTRGIHDAKNPYPAPVTDARELFQKTQSRNCVHIELDIEGSGLTYQHGDHVGVWPSNADVEVDRLLCALGLWEKRDTVIDVTSLDPTLAKVPFPVPTTYGTVLRHYLDISALVGRQVIGNIAQHAPTPEAEAFLKRVNEKAEYSRIVGAGCLKLGEVLQLAAGNDLKAAPTAENTTAWNIPFDKIVSSIPRLQPRYYSISSSPKLHPNKVHVTCVVLKYNSAKTDGIDERLVFGVGSNYLLNVKFATHSNNEDYLPLVSEPAEGLPAQVSNPAYAIMGPRSAYKGDASYKIPVHIRRSTFRLPTNPRTPVIMIGPGTGVAPFRGFVQERVAAARRAVEKNGADALADWGRITLFYGCRRSDEDFLYADEWPKYADELKDKFVMHNAFSRERFRPDGSKIYVQDLIWDDREAVADAILKGKGYVYICGDAKAMSKAVEDTLAKILGEAKGGNKEVEGVKELKMLKERSRLMLDVWS